MVWIFFTVLTPLIPNSIIAPREGGYDQFENTLPWGILFGVNATTEIRDQYDRFCLAQINPTNLDSNHIG
jgi:hypothetical protein